MPDLHTFVNQINGGEMSPQMDGRVDVEKYQTGARVLENFIVRPYGGIYKRPGTDFVATTYENRYSRLLPFESTNGSFQLEFTIADINSNNGNLRIWDTYDTTYGNVNDDYIYDVDYVADDITYPTKDKTDFYKTWASLDNVTSQRLTAGWVSGSYFAANQGIFYNNNLYIASVTHYATTATAPGSGSSWSNYWNAFSYNTNDVIYWGPFSNDLTNSVGFRALSSTSKWYPTSAAMLADTGTWEQLKNFPKVNFNTPYKSIDDLKNIQICPINDVIFIAHPNYPPKKLTRSSRSKWYFEDVKWDFAPTLDVNDTTNYLQLQFNEPYWVHNYTYNIGDRVTVLDTLSSTSIYTCHTAHTSNSANNATGFPGNVTNWRNFWNYGTSNIKYLKWSAGTVFSVGDKAWYGNTIYECLIAHTAVTTTTTTKGGQNGDNEPTKGKKWTAYWKIADSVNAAKNVNYVLNASEDVFDESLVGETWQLNIAADDYYLKTTLPGPANTSIVTADTDVIFLQGAYLVLSNWTVNNAPRGTFALEESLDGQTWNIVQQWLVDATTDSNINYTGEAPATGAWYRFSGYRNEASSGSFRLTLEPLDFTLKLPFEIKEVIDSKTVKGIVKTFNNQLVPSQIIGKATANYRKPAFSASSGYPSSVAFHENRLWWGGVTTQPGRIWGSEKDDYYTYLIGTKATDALDLTLQSTTTSRILWLKSYNKSLVAGTGLEIFTVDSGESDAQISSTNIRARARASIGACNIPGIVTADSLLYFQNGKRKLRELSYNFSRDAWDVPDMTIYAEHIGQEGFVEASYMNAPEPILWVIGTNGALMGFSYDRTQNITAWHRHITGDRNAFYGVSGSDPNAAGYFRSVSVVNGINDLADDVWFVVERKKDNNTNYCIERFNRGMMNFIYGDSSLASGNNLTSKNIWRFSDCAVNYTQRGTFTSPTRTYYIKLTFIGSGGGVYDVPAGGDKVYTFNNSLSSGIVDNINPILSAGVGVIFNGTIPAALNGITLRPTVGIPIFSVYVPNRFEVQLQNGSSQGRKLRVNRVAFRNWKSSGGKFNVYNAFQTSLMDGVTALEMKPSPNDSYTNINYNNYNFNIQTSRQTTPVYLYSGQTDDQAINMNWTENPLFTIAHSDQTPFNLLGIVYKMEVQGN